MGGTPKAQTPLHNTYDGAPRATRWMPVLHSRVARAHRAFSRIRRRNSISLCIWLRHFQDGYCGASADDRLVETSHPRYRTTTLTTPPPQDYCCDAACPQTIRRRRFPPARSPVYVGRNRQAQPVAADPPRMGIHCINGHAARPEQSGLPDLRHLSRSTACTDHSSQIIRRPQPSETDTIPTTLWRGGPATRPEPAARRHPDRDYYHDASAGLALTAQTAQPAARRPLHAGPTTRSGCMTDLPPTPAPYTSTYT